jgi:flagellar M-ring protein FliF
VLANVREAWRRMGLGQRLAMLVLLGVCGGAAALVVGWVRRPHLALLYAGLEPQEAARLFQGDSKGTSATVVLRLQPGWRLTAGNIAAVVHLVAGSVENCKAADVVVVDSAGNLLSGEGGDAFAKSAGTLLDYKTQVEQYLAKKAEDMLTMVLGPRRAAVRVDAKIETSSVNQTVEKFDPGGKVPAKEETKTKSASGGAKPAEGAAPSAGTTKEETVLTDYLVSRTLEQTVNMPGKILSLSVAAFVDLSPPEAAPGAAGAAEGTAPPAAPAQPLQTKDVEEIIRNAIGLQEADTLKVVAIPFHRAPAPEVSEEEENFLASPGFYLDLARHASVGILVLGALVVLKMFGSARRRALQAAGAGSGVEGGSINLLAGGQPLVASPDELKGRITAALQDNPQEVKRLFRTWVEGEKGGA